MTSARFHAIKGAELTENGTTKRLGCAVAKFLAGSWRAVQTNPKISVEELNEIAPLLLKSGAGGLAWWRIRGGALSQTAAGLELNSAYRLHSLQTAIHKAELIDAVSLLNDLGVEPVLVKGWAVARLYPEEGLRPYGDIDLCITPDKYQTVNSRLSIDDIRKNSVDLHEGFRKLDPMSADELMSRTERVTLGSATFRLLGAEDQLRILCTHFLRHSAWRPLWLCDIATVVETLPAGFDWDRCLGRKKRESDWVLCAIGLANRLLGADIEKTPAAKRARELPRWLIGRVIRNWDRPFPENYPPLLYVPPIATYLRNPTGLLSALRKRWPDPIEATIRLRGPMNEMPRLPYQIGNALLRITRFLTRTQ